MKKLIALVLSSLIILTLASCDDENKRVIYVRSNGRKYLPVAFNRAGYEKGKNLTQTAREIVEGLPEIKITDNIKIVTKGKTHGRKFALIPEHGNILNAYYEDNEFKNAPSGKYILRISVTWEDGNEKEYIDYFFKINIVNGYVPISNYVGKVAIKSEGKEYAPLENWIFALNIERIEADGFRKYPKNVSAELQAIPVSEDFKIIIEGEYKRGAAYTLFNAEYEQLYYYQPEYTEPEAPGEYILEIVASWGNDIENSGYQYFFKIVK